jgi:hypothetical protein
MGHRDLRTLKRNPTLSLGASEIERLDAIMLSIYGCTLREYAFRFYSHAYNDGFQKGRKEGYSAGRRATKGLKPAKAHGHPLEVDKGLLALISSKVNKRTSGTTVEQSIKEFLEIMRLGSKTLGRSEELPSTKKAKAAYYRHRKKESAGSEFLNLGELFSKPIRR